MTEAAYCHLATANGWVTLAGARLSRILSAELFRELVGLPAHAPYSELASTCHDRWTDLAAALIALPDPAEAVMLVAGGVPDEAGRGQTTVAFLAIGRGDDQASAQASCARSFRDIWTLLVTTLDYAELRVIEDPGLLERLGSYLGLRYAVEIRRRLERVRIGHGVADRAVADLGFIRAARVDVEGPEPTELAVEHLFPWVPSDDPWRRLLEALSAEPGLSALVVHLRGCGRAPSRCEDAVLEAMAAGERAVRGLLEPGQQARTVLADAAHALRQGALARLSLLRGGVLAARSFLLTSQPASAGLVATVLRSLDDASVRPEQAGAAQLFRGGARVLPTGAEEVLKPLNDPDLDLLFGPREGSAIVRTPMPTDVDLPGLPANRARTAAFGGRSGGDCTLGINVHRDVHLPVTLDEPTRFRHTYLVGQTGTGKSTLLLHMILHDIGQGRGVAVLDPHGSLIEDVLLRLPPSRIDDVVLVDVSDVEWPVGFNILRIDEEDPLRYLAARDLLIDDLYGFIDRLYDMKVAGGPIFETHFRGMLALLLGLDRQVAPLIPNLTILRALYTNKTLRQLRCARLAGRDFVIDEFIREATAAAGEASLTNIAPYVTSKFSRFISDSSLRNITCQREIIDFDHIVNEGKILLFYLGKGRFGDQPAGLLASQVVSRIRRSVMKRGTRAGQRPFFLYADEFQLFADERFGELLAEARKFGLSLTVAHQYAQQLPEKILHAVLGNVGTIVAFRVGPPDGALLETLFAPHFNRRDLTSLSNYRAYVRPTGPLGQTPFSLETRASSLEVDGAVADEVRRRSRERHGRERSVVEAEIRETYDAYMGILETDE
jgi:hypothetical protein